MDPGYDPIGQAWDPIAKDLGLTRTVECSREGQQHVMLGTVEGFDVTLATASREDDATAKSFRLTVQFEDAQDPETMLRGLAASADLAGAFRAVTEEELRDGSMEVGHGVAHLTATLRAPFVLGGQRAVVALVRAFLRAVSEEAAPLFDRCTSCWQNEVSLPARLSHRTVRLCATCQEHPAPAVDGPRPPLPHILADRAGNGRPAEGRPGRAGRAREAARLLREDEARYRARLARWVRLGRLAGTVFRLSGKSSTSLDDKLGGLGRYALAPRELPRFFEWLEPLARRAGTPLPDLVVLETGAVAAAEEEASGLQGYRRVLRIGVPVLEILHPDELAAVLTRELRHFWQEDDLALEARRVVRTLTAGRLAAEIGPRAWPLLRDCELEADRVAASCVSAGALASGMAKVLLLEDLWRESVEHGTWKAASEGPSPPEDPCTRWLEAIGEVPAEQVDHRLRRLLREKDHAVDPRPPLGVRLEALGIPGPVGVTMRPGLTARSREKMDEYDRHRKLLLTTTLQRTAHGFADLHRFSQVLAARAGLLEQRVIAYPGLRLALVELAQVRAKLEDTGSAIRWFRKAHELDPSRSEAACELLRLLSHRGDPREALPFLEGLAPTLGEDWRLALPAIELLEVSGRHEAARSLTLQLLEKLPAGEAEAFREGLEDLGFELGALQAEGSSGAGARPVGATHETPVTSCLVCRTGLESKPHQECPVCHFEVHLECGRAIGGCARLECARAAAPRRRAMNHLRSRVDRRVLAAAAVAAILASATAASLVVALMSPEGSAGRPLLGLVGFALPAMIAWLSLEGLNQGRVIRGALRGDELLCADLLKILKMYCGKTQVAADGSRLCRLWLDELTRSLAEQPARTEQLVAIGDGPVDAGREEP